jgi:hypothetical protein
MQTERKSSQARAAGSRPSRGPSHVVERDFALALKSAKAFEAHELYKNRSENQAGNQVDTPRGTCGTAPVAKGGDSNHVILSVELRSPRR